MDFCVGIRFDGEDFYVVAISRAMHLAFFLLDRRRSICSRCCDTVNKIGALMALSCGITSLERPIEKLKRRDSHEN